jgi:DNA repair protein RecO (recombination protein O)
MEWTDQGIVLFVQAHGETSAIAEVLTDAHGRHKGLVRGGRGKRMVGVLQTGNEVACTWQARLSEHLGSFAIELKDARAARLMDNPLRLAGLTSLTATASMALPEREPHPSVYKAARAVLDAMEMAPPNSIAWVAGLVRWELGLLQELGFALDLSSCAATGQVDDLTFVSPRSGRAVNTEAAAPYVDKLLPLPGFLRPGQAVTADREQPQLVLEDIEDGLRLTGHFLDRHIFHGSNRPPPAARARFLEKISRFRETYTGNHNI